MILSALVIGEVVPVLRRGKRAGSGPATDDEQVGAHAE
jgi:hypothetical protein